MKPLDLIAFIITHTLDGLYAGIPRNRPSIEKLRACRLISHRGEHDNRTVFENTLAAFNTACRQGVWGIECDVRWTRDLVPIVFHDADLARIFNVADRIARTEFGRLRRDYPLIPTLNEVLTRFGRVMHLMVEIKTETYPDPDYQCRVLADEFSRLLPVKDYHFLSLNPAMFRYVEFAPPATCIPVAQANVAAMSRLALQNNFGGVAGHYAFVSRSRMQAHHQRGQQVGTAYVRSRNSLYREIHRGADWLFSNHAVKVQRILNHAVEKAARL